MTSPWLLFANILVASIVAHLLVTMTIVKFSAHLMSKRERAAFAESGREGFRIADALNDTPGRSEQHTAFLETAWEPRAGDDGELHVCCVRCGRPLDLK